MRAKLFGISNLFIVAHLFSVFGSALLYYVMIMHLLSVYSQEAYANYILIYTAINTAAILFTGVITDRFNKLKILPFIQIINAILLFIMSFIFAAGNERYLIYIIIVMSAANGIDSNLTSSALPLYIEKTEKLKTTNAFLQLGTRGINVLVGMTAVLLFERKLYREGFWLNSLTIAKPISMAIARVIDAHSSIEIYFAVMVIALSFTLIILNQKRELS